MLSQRGAITTNVALVECAAGQNHSDKNLFLLSELEKVWVSLAVVTRRLLLDEKVVHIAPLGTFWLEEYVLVRDRQLHPYLTHKLCFGISQRYADRYGVDTSKVPLEPRMGAGDVRVSMADIVPVCAVPAHTASAALREFFMYLGEGLARNRVFQLALPGIATIGIKKQKMVLQMSEDFRLAVYERDSRRWPVDVRAEARLALESLALVPGSGFSSARTSRPTSTRASRLSWTADNSMKKAEEGKKAVFIAAAPTGRDFDEIAQEEFVRRRAARASFTEKREQQRRQAELDYRIQQYSEAETYHIDPASGLYSSEGNVNATGATEDVGVGRASEEDNSTPNSRPRPNASGESIYNVFSQRNERKAAQPEPEVEAVEIVGIEEEGEGEENRTASGTVNGGGHASRVLATKDLQLECILREEEAFSRPHSRRHEVYTASSARDLIYCQPYEVSAGPVRPSISTSATVAPAVMTEMTPPPTASSTRGQAEEDVLRYGRKRFFGNYYDDDHVRGLMQYRA